jgi:hypothetical protein
VARGHDGSRDLYGEVLNRIAVGEYVLDEERVTGIEMEGSPSEAHAAAVYRVVKGKIAHMWLPG